VLGVSVLSGLARHTIMRTLTQLLASDARPAGVCFTAVADSKPRRFDIHLAPRKRARGSGFIFQAINSIICLDVIPRRW
jgi:hypothetical protein